MFFSSRCISIVIGCIVILISSQSAFAKRPKRWGVKFERFLPPLELGEQKIVNFTIQNLNKTELTESLATIRAVSDSDVLRAYKAVPLSEIESNQWHGSVQVEAVFIGAAHLYVEIVRPDENDVAIERSTGFLPIQIMRKRVPEWMYNEIYNICESALYFIIRMIFGMVIDWCEITAILRNPVGIGISFFCSHIFLPLVS